MKSLDLFTLSQIIRIKISQIDLLHVWIVMNVQTLWLWWWKKHNNMKILWQVLKCSSDLLAFLFLSVLCFSKKAAFSITKHLNVEWSFLLVAKLTCSLSKISRRCSSPRLFKNWQILSSVPASTHTHTQTHTTQLFVPALLAEWSYCS